MCTCIPPCVSGHYVYCTIVSVYLGGVLKKTPYPSKYFWKHCENIRTIHQFTIQQSCCGRVVKTSDFHTGGPWFEFRHGSSALGQGSLSSLPSLRRRVTPHAIKQNFTSCKRAGRNPGEVVRQSNILKQVNDIEPWWFTQEGYIKHNACSLRITSARHLNMPYKRKWSVCLCISTICS